jgi:hypothetical protein
MASGLQCPGCGHVHPAGLPEIARGDTTFRCYGCYRTLSIPEGWTGRPTPRPSVPQLSGDAPPGAGTRDARSARLGGRRGGRAGALTGPGAVGPGTGGPGVVGSGAGGPGLGAAGDFPTQVVPPATAGAGAYGASAPATDWAGAAAATGAAPAAWGGAAAPGAARRTAADWRAAPRPGESSGGRAASAPLGWTVPRAAADRSVPTGIRASVWAAAFVVGLVIAAFALRKAGLLDVDTVIDLYAGSGPGRFGILLVLLPLWALLSATIAHLALEALARRRRPQVSAPDRPAESPTFR